MNIMYLLKESFYQGFPFFYLMLILTFNLIIVGPLASYFDFEIAYWIGRGLFFILFVMIFIPNLRNALVNKLFAVVGLLFLMVMFSLILTPSIELVKTGFKDYVLPVVAMLAVLVIRMNEYRSFIFYKILRFVSIVQFPFIVQQFFIESRRGNLLRESDWDLIVGTFGFNSNGGGNSAGFVLFQCFMLTIISSKIRRGIGDKLDYLALILIALSVVMAETKIFLILLVFIFLSIYKFSDILNFKKVITTLVVIVGVSFVLLSSYNSNTTNVNDENRSMDEYVRELYDDYFLEDVLNYKTGEVGRNTALKIWVEKQDIRGWPVESFFGYGLTSSKLTNNDISEAQVFGMYINIASSQAAIYLWDVGILGLLTYYIFIFILMIMIVFSKWNNSLNYIFVFKSGSVFLLLASIIYPFYSTTMHANTITHSVLLISILYAGNVYNHEALDEA